MFETRILFFFVKIKFILVVNFLSAHLTRVGRLRRVGDRDEHVVEPVPVHGCRVGDRHGLQEGNHLRERAGNAARPQDAQTAKR